MLYNLLSLVLCCQGNVTAFSEGTVTDTDFSDVDINDSQIAFDTKVSPTDPKKYPPPYETPVVPQRTADFLTQAGIPYTATSPYPQPRPPSIYTQPQAATGSFSWAEDRPYPNQYPPPYETPKIQQRTADDSYTQTGIPYTAASVSPYYRQPRAATHQYHGHDRRTHASLTDMPVVVPPVYLMPTTSDGRAVLIRPPYYRWPWRTLIEKKSRTVICDSLGVFTSIN